MARRAVVPAGRCCEARRWEAGGCLVAAEQQAAAERQAAAEQQAAAERQAAGGHQAAVGGFRCWACQQGGVPA